MDEAPTSGRHISTQQAAFIGVAAMVGAGIFSLLGAAGEVAGAAVWLSFLLAGGIAALQGYSFAKLGAKFPSAGGLLEYVNQGFGDGHVATVVAWLTYIANGIVTAMVALSFGSYASSAFAGDSVVWVKIFAVALLVTMTILNIAGSGVVARVQSIVVFVVIGILAFFSAVTVTNIEPGYLAPSTYPGAQDIISSVALTFFAFLGFGVVTFTAKDLARPGKQLPRAMTIAIGLATVIYVAVSIGVFGTLTVPEVIAAGPTAIAVAAQPVLGDAGYWLMTVTALFATAGATNSGLYPATGPIRPPRGERPVPDADGPATRRPSAVRADHPGGRDHHRRRRLRPDRRRLHRQRRGAGHLRDRHAGPPADPRRHRGAPQHRAPGPGRRDHHARDLRGHHAHPRASLDGDPRGDPRAQYRARCRLVASQVEGDPNEHRA